MTRYEWKSINYYLTLLLCPNILEWFSTPYSPNSSRSHRSEILLQRNPLKRSEPLKYKVNLINKRRWDLNLWPSDQNPTTPLRPTTSHIIFNGWRVALFRDVSHVLCSQLRDLRLFRAHSSVSLHLPMDVNPPLESHL